MSKLSKENIVEELTSSTNAIESITGKKVELFRPPYGDYNDLLIETAKELNLYTIQWDVDSLDWKNLSSSEIENRVLKKVKNGSIVLFHNQGLHTHEALEGIIKTLKEKGYTFVTIGELIYKGDYKMLPDGTQTKNAL
jgi:peptidoglycan/xylan/chitin deacetylase (PgdA/CDA1 family)